MSQENVWLYINHLMKRGKDYYTGLTHFIVREMHWELNFRSDMLVVIYHTNGVKHILQVGGDLFYPLEVHRRITKYEDEKYDGYLMPMKEVLRFINIMLYEDMELNYEEEGSERCEDTRDEYDLFYNGDNEKAFDVIFDKMMNWEEILEEDVVGL